MITIRLLEKTERNKLDKVYTMVVKIEFPEYSENIKKYFTSGNYKQEMLDAFLVLGGFDNDELVAFLIAERPFGGVIFVQWLAVLPKYQKKGIGSLLLKKFEIEAKKVGAHNILLQTLKHNIPFYELHGYEVIGFEKKGYFGTDNYYVRKLIQDVREENLLKY